MRTNHGRLSANLKIGLLLGIALLIALPAPALAKDPNVKTMTRNLYLGADIFKVVDAAFIPNPEDPNGKYRGRCLQTYTYMNSTKINGHDLSAPPVERVLIFERLGK